MKKIIYSGSTQKEISHFPEKARSRVMMALTVLCAGMDLNPKEFKYMPTIGAGCYELRIKVDKQYRVFFVTKFHEAIYLLHAFVKKTEQTSKSDIDLGATRYKALIKYRQENKYDKRD